MALLFSRTILVLSPNREQLEEGKMRATKNELPVLLEAGLSTVRGVDWGEMRVGVVSVPAGTDFAPLLSGLPDDR